MMETTITESSDNVFADLGFEPPEAAILEMRASLMCDLRAYLQSSEMTQDEATEKMRIAQSRISDLMRGKWEKFSLEMLITLEARLGRKVTLELEARML
jgi:predicted XRE-type DNA-binding protein